MISRNYIKDGAEIKAYFGAAINGYFAATGAEIKAYFGAELKSYNAEIGAELKAYFGAELQAYFYDTETPYTCRETGDLPGGNYYFISAPIVAK